LPRSGLIIPTAAQVLEAQPGDDFAAPTWTPTMHTDAPSSRQLAELVARYVHHLERCYRSRAWMTARSQLARLLLSVDTLEYEQLRDAARALAADATLSKTYRRDTIGTWRRFLAWCSEELIIDASTVDRFAHVRLRFPMPPPTFSPGEISTDSAPSAEGTPRGSTTPPGSAAIAPDAPVTPRRGRRAGAVSRTAPDPRRDPEAFASVVFEALPLLAPDLRAVVRLLLLTGARPSELLRLTTFAIDTTSTPWLARLDDHKTADQTGEPRIIILGPAAARILDPRLRPFTPLDWLFPAPKNPSAPIARDLVQKRLRRTLQRHQRPLWTLYDARRWAATVARGSEGLEAAQRLLGHSRASTTEIYAPPLLEHAIRAARHLERRATK
jgi:integrase